jgi:hypothetical protein
MTVYYRAPGPRTYVECRLRKSEWRYLRLWMTPGGPMPVRHVKGLGALEARLLKRGLIETMGPMVAQGTRIVAWNWDGVSRVSTLGLDAFSRHPPHWGYPDGPANCH